MSYCPESRAKNNLPTKKATRININALSNICRSEIFCRSNTKSCLAVEYKIKRLIKMEIKKYKKITGSIILALNLF